MLNAFRSGGVMMWPLLLIALGIGGVAVRAARAARSGAPREELERTLQTILFWGAMSVVLGLLGTAVGLVQMASALQRVTAVSASTVWGGVGVALVTLIFGLLILLASLLLWFGLRRRLAGNSAPASLV